MGRDYSLYCTILSILSTLEDTAVDGPGFRTTVYCAGHPNACPGCYNPQTWDIHSGQWMQVEDIMRVIEANPFANATSPEGDPMFQAEGFAELAYAIKTRANKIIWCYTGFTFEALIKNPQRCQLLGWIDVLVNGPFVEKLKDPNLFFRGSSNQRIINVPLSLQQGKAMLWEQEDDIQTR